MFFYPFVHGKPRANRRATLVDVLSLNKKSKFIGLALFLDCWIFVKQTILNRNKNTPNTTSFNELFFPGWFFLEICYQCKYKIKPWCGNS
jgi:hypothetical protein